MIDSNVVPTGSANFAALAPGKFALRGLCEFSVILRRRSGPGLTHETHPSTAQNLAREFGPQGVHVSHVIVDGAFRPLWVAEKKNPTLL